jgi:hypothetical protein
MRPPNKVDQVDWAAFPRPEMVGYDPADVPIAIHRLEALADGADASREASICRYACGNDHCGFLYPLAPAVVPFLVWFIAYGSQAARRAAFEALDDLSACFMGDPVEFPAGSGEELPVERVLRLTLRDELNALMKIEAEPEVQATVSRLRATLAEADAS